MTDKLPIERLEELLQLAESEEAGYARLIASLEFEGRRPSDDYYRDLKDWRDNASSFRELIALRKAEPEVYGLTQDGEVYAFSTDKPDATHVQLIRKP